MAKNALYTLSELAQASETSPRTIRYYTSEGLLPPPQSRGRFALYGAAHVNRLRLIGLLKQAMMPLGTMRERLPQLSDAQIAALLAQSGAYENLLQRADGEAVFPLREEAVGTPLETQSEAYRALADALAARKDAASRSGAETLSASSAFSVTAGSAENQKGIPQKEAATKPASGKVRRALLVSSRLNAAPDSGAQNENALASSPGADTWQRILLAPGVELHVRTPDSPDAREHLALVIAEARSLFQP